MFSHLSRTSKGTNGADAPGRSLFASAAVCFVPGLRLENVRNGYQSFFRIVSH